VFLAKLSKLLCFHRFAGGSLLDITAQHCVRTKLRFYSGRLSVTHITWNFMYTNWRHLWRKQARSG